DLDGEAAFGRRFAGGWLDFDFDVLVGIALGLDGQRRNSLGPGTGQLDLGRFGSAVPGPVRALGGRDAGDIGPAAAIEEMPGHGVGHVAARQVWIASPSLFEGAVGLDVLRPVGHQDGLIGGTRGRQTDESGTRGTDSLDWLWATINFLDVDPWRQIL